MGKKKKLNGEDLLDIYNHLEYAYYHYYIRTEKVKRDSIRKLQSKIIDVLKQLELRIIE